MSVDRRKEERKNTKERERERLYSFPWVHGETRALFQFLG